MTDEQIKYMADRFLGWRLPDDFCPDAGISFEPRYNVGTPYENKNLPIGTNLFDASQAEAMVRYMLEGLPTDEPKSKVDTSSEAVEHLADAHTGRTSLFKNKPHKKAHYHFHKTTGEVLRALAKERDALANELSEDLAATSYLARAEKAEQELAALKEAMKDAEECLVEFLAQSTGNDVFSTEWRYKARAALLGIKGE